MIVLFVCFLIEAPMAEAHLPRAELRVAKQAFVQGEPIGVEFVVSNISDEAIQSRYSSDDQFARTTTPLQLEFRTHDAQSAHWVSSDACAPDSYAWRQRDSETGRWFIELKFGAELRARFQVVPSSLALKPNSPNKEPRALSPGDYELVGVIPWIENDKPLRTSPITVKIIEPDRADERQAAELVDFSYIGTSEHSFSRLELWAISQFLSSC